MSRSSGQSASDEIPPAIPNHTLHRRIGQGTYGEVWLATDTMSKWRAVKVVSRREDDRTDHGYQREFKAIKQYEGISHTHGSLMPILNVGRDPADRYFYYSMELADDARTNDRLDSANCTPEQGAAIIQDYQPRTLRAELRRRGRLPPSECVAHAIALATALERLHAGGLIHRDIKPDNIIFVHGVPKLADVGSVADVAATYSLAGTTAYLSPEAERKEPADIFALGLVLYEMTTGRDAMEFPMPPENFGTFSEEERSAINELNAVLLKACDPEAPKRHRSASHLREELELRKKNGSVIRLRELEERDQRRRRQVRTLLLTCAVVVSFSLLGFYVWSINQRAAEQEVRRELRDIQITRTKKPFAGWFAENWPRLERAAAIHTDQEVLEQATAMIAGLDARLIKKHEGVAGGSAAFGPDGRAIIGGLGTNACMLMDTNGDLTRLPVRGEGPVCWPPDSAPLQLSVVSNRLVLREAVTGAVRRQFLQLEKAPSGFSSASLLALAPDGSSVAVALGERILVWSAATGELLGEVTADATALAFSPDGSQLGVGEVNGTTRVYPVPGFSPEIVLRHTSRASSIGALAFIRDPVIPYTTNRHRNSWLLATADQGTEIVIWDLQQRLPRTYCHGSIWTTTTLAFHPDGLMLASAGQAVGRLWDGARGLPLLGLRTGTGQVRFLTFDREGQRLICGAEPGAGIPVIQLWELAPGHGIHALRALKAAARKVWFSPDGRRLAALSDDWRLGIWEMSSRRLVALLESPVGVLADNAGGAFDAGGKRFAFASGREACLFNLASGGVIQRWPLAGGFADQLQFDTHDRLLLLRREWIAKTPRSVWRLQELAGAEHPVLLHEQTETNWSALDMAFAPGGEKFLVWNGWPSETNQFIRAIEVSSGRELWRAGTGNASGDMRVCFDPSGRSFAFTTAAPPRSVVTRFADFKEIGRTENYWQAIGPFGEQFGGDRVWTVIDRRSQEPGITLVTDCNALSFVSAFSPDGKLLAWGTEEGVVLVADIQAVRERLSALRR